VYNALYPFVLSYLLQLSTFQSSSYLLPYFVSVILDHIWPCFPVMSLSALHGESTRCTVSFSLSFYFAIFIFCTLQRLSHAVKCIPFNPSEPWKLIVDIVPLLFSVILFSKMCDIVYVITFLHSAPTMTHVFRPHRMRKIWPQSTGNFHPDSL